MKIYIDGRTVGIYGGFAQNLPQFNSYLQNQLILQGFSSTFEELWVTFAYPPTFILNGIIGMKEEYEHWYKTFNFPYSRLNRRYKKIDITLKTPEFSESFEFINEDYEYQKLEIEEKYKNIPRVDIAKIMIDYLIYIGGIIKSKLKKDDNFDFEKYSQILSEIKNKITDSFLDEIGINESKKNQDENQFF